MPRFDLQMQWIEQIQKTLRSTFLDGFFIGWDYVESIYFVMLLIIIVWYLIDRKIGIKMFYILLFSVVMNGFIKTLLEWPRPCQIEPSTTVWTCYTTFGFPSGAAQSAMIYLGVLLIECKKKIYWLWGALFAFLLCFSRIYLGLHFFTDILAGLGLGAILVLIYWKIFPLLERKWKHVIILFPFLILPFTVHATLIFFYISIGAGIGLLLPVKKEKKPWIEALSASLGCVFFLFLGLVAFPHLSPLLAVLAGFWVSFMGSKIVLH